MPRRTRRTRKPVRRTRRSVRVPVGIILTVILLFVLLSLAFHVAGLQTAETNYCGWLGHQVARGLLHILGYAGFALPLLAGAALLLGMWRQPPWRRFFAFTLLATGVIIGGSLLSYQTAPPLPEVNFAGWLGALLAGSLSRALGLGAFVLPILIILWGTALWHGRLRERSNLTRSGFVLIAGLFLDVFVAYFGPGAFWNPAPGTPGTFHLAGQAGVAATTGLKHVLGPVGTIIVLIAAVIILLVLFTTVQIRIPGTLLASLRERLRRHRQHRQDAAAVPKPVPAPTEHEPEPEPAPDTEPDPAAKTRPVASRKRRTPKLRDFDLNRFQQAFLDQLDKPGPEDRQFKDPRESEREAELLLDKLRQFDIDGRVSRIESGPMITRFEFEPAPGIKLQRIGNLADDLSLALSAERIRILAPIPGRNAVGIEIPNKTRLTVHLRDVLTSDEFARQETALGFALGSTITGDPYCADVSRMPHILIAGTTGSGKSVCINSIIASIIYRASYHDVRFLTIDPKQLELPVYNSIPHLLSRTTIDPRQAVNQLDRVVRIMEVRYAEFANLGVRDIATFNKRASTEGIDPKPYIVVIIDELADLMLRAPTEIEERITRLAQMSRAVGIHLILATQRPSVDVITGLIKANFPCRVAFQVASKTDSRTVLDMNGAEGLLGRGDMLFLPPGKGDAVRLHGSFISADASIRIVNLWTIAYLTEKLTGRIDDPAAKAQAMVEADVVDVLYDRSKRSIRRKRDRLAAILPEPVIDELMEENYYEPLPEVRSGAVEKHEQRERTAARQLDDKFDHAAKIVVRHKEASVSMLQRRLDVGWARAGRIIDQLEEYGIVGPYVGSKSRKVLIDSEAGLLKLLEEIRNPESTA